MSIEFVGSPNYNERPLPGIIAAIVLHSCVCDNLPGLVDWFNNPEANVSAHYSIGKDGETVQHVMDSHRAWHAGESSWNGRADLNSWAIGIEFVNWNSGTDPYPEAQYQAALTLCLSLCKKYGIHSQDVVAHYDVSPDRKTDPMGFDMPRLRREIEERK